MNHVRRHASADFCFGRTELCNQVRSSAFQSRALLLFGGRQTGKTTILKRIVADLSVSRGNVTMLDDIDIGVFVDLMSLPCEAKPSDFFLLLPNLARDACTRQIDGFKLETLPSQNERHLGSLDQFIRDMKALFNACGETSIRVLFLLDESKRVLGDRFPRGFQDNLFALLFGDEIGIRDRTAMVFAGAQDLYRFCEDDTSPIGSRASRCFVSNLDRSAVVEMVADVCAQQQPSEEAAELIFARSGGHAGLSVRLAEEVARRENAELGEVVSAVRSDFAPLFKLWILALSDEARCVQDILASRDTLEFPEITRSLEESGFDRFAADRVCEELQFTGLALLKDSKLNRVNEAYWEYLRGFSYDKAGAPAERDVWVLIEELELGLRKIVRDRFEQLWPGKAIERMKRVLGRERSDRIERFKEKSYPYSDGYTRDELECMYLGELGDLMLSSDVWKTFEPTFRDKRQLQDLLAAITPVRTDRAHFVKVPSKELDRCRIACDDLLIILERSVEH